MPPTIYAPHAGNIYCCSYIVTIIISYPKVLINLNVVEPRIIYYNPNDTMSMGKNIDSYSAGMGNGLRHASRSAA